MLSLGCTSQKGGNTHTRSNYQAGHEAERWAAIFLQEQGYHILALNWHTRRCEVDIVAEKSKCVYFVEVKYRRRTDQGIGLDYITPQKLRRMQFAAACWVQRHTWRGLYQLAALSVDGETFRLELLEA